MSGRRKRKKSPRGMTGTEFQGYKRSHKAVEDPVFRERSKTDDAKRSYAREQSRVSSDFREALQSQDLDALEKLEKADKELGRKARGIKTRNTRMKLLEDLDDKK